MVKTHKATRNLSPEVEYQKTEESVCQKEWEILNANSLIGLNSVLVYHVAVYSRWIFQTDTLKVVYQYIILF